MLATATQPTTTFAISNASILDLDDLAPLFVAYRQFYIDHSLQYAQCPQSPEEARAFLAERLVLGDSRLYIARNAENQAIGFAQVFMSFSSMVLCRSWVLNDLFVSPDSRGQKIGEALLAHVELEAKATGVAILTMETSPENVHAHRLYQQMGYVREMGHLHFVRKLS
ncbi:GNAT family N-acetyltransferase [Chitinibacter bivalviorum]|uniref:GNAT family N-acetyltransferase n=1 Tax=Chitinibacter bivalviorum TaxID=2739434 RepID=A0A7H9BKY4_9NEIS|nr:GNAT family N-acetyltransferase [Chitinibacter bivalviorum]QLG89340.1 GNAT family N-acetyltransferase [Chitinibacter bivalviorum]